MISFYSIIYSIIIYPLELIYELIYSLVMRIVPIPGVSIIILSIFINTMLVPIYKLIDAIQKEQYEKEKELSFWIAHIKKYFNGDERFLMLKTYYRQNDYTPLSSLKGALPLMLEFPFFIGAFHFLTRLNQLDGVPFLFIRDLAKPDGLINVSGMSFNIMPVFMTIINLVSAGVYTDKKSIREKVTMYVIAIVFLIILYDSGSGLVLYWTMNNIFTLIKNIVLKRSDSKDTNLSNENKNDNKGIVWGFILCEIAMILLLGVVIPTGVIKASPLEFIDTSDIHNPLIFVTGSVAIAFGYFGIWLNFFYYISGDGRNKLYKYISVLLVIGIVDYFFFGTEMGIISSHLKYVKDVEIGFGEILINILIISIVILICHVLYIKNKKVIYYINVSSVIALMLLSIINITSINKAYNNIDFSETESEKMNIPLSTSGKNVVVFMLDRAIGSFIPYIMNEKPELKKQFEGFTYYPNTVSLGTNTGDASAAVFGGYEYTADVVEDVTKRTEALTLLPKIFKDNNYEVTVFDPPFLKDDDIANLSLAVFENMDIRAFHAKDKFHFSYKGKESSDRRYRNFFCYSVSKACPLAFNYTLYDGGYYNDVTIYATKSVYSYMVNNDNMSKGTSFIYTFEQEYAELENLSDITEITEDNVNTYFAGYNEATHEPTILKEPEYVPALYVDNTEYDEKNKDRFIVDGRVMNVDNAEQMHHYQVNVASLLQLGKWFDYLRENGVYDNTRIIIAADHGGFLNNFDDMIFEQYDLEALNPLLMEKDFNSKIFSVDDSFMVNADVPAMALQDIIEDKVNPYTGEKLEAAPEDKNPVTIKQLGLEVKDNIFDLSNWKMIK